MVKVKICGVTNLEDALAAVEAGADALGFVFAPSPRRVTAEEVRAIVGRLPPSVQRVGVFVDEALDQVKDAVTACGLDFAQLHGSEAPEYCLALAHRAIKAFRVKDPSVLEELHRYRVAMYLLDAYHPALAGGTGTAFDWAIAVKAKEYGPIILSGGLTPGNVARAVREVRPAVVDASSGVEARPGRKDAAKMRAFVDAAKGT